MLKVLVINQSGWKMGSALDLKPADLEHIFKVTAIGSLVAAQEVLPAQVKNAKGTIIFTGATAAIRGGAVFSGFAPAKFAVRALSQVEISMKFQFNSLVPCQRISTKRNPCCSCDC